MHAVNYTVREIEWNRKFETSQHLHCLQQEVEARNEADQLVAFHQRYAQAVAEQIGVLTRREEKMIVS
jgi:hypothetical protein